MTMAFVHPGMKPDCRPISRLHTNRSPGPVRRLDSNAGDFEVENDAEEWLDGEFEAVFAERQLKDRVSTEARRLKNHLDLAC